MIEERPKAPGVLRTALRVLTFTASREELVALDRRHLAFGLICTWIVGIGRWWDDPNASLLLHTGLGSVAYVFVLSALLFLIIRPLRPRDWSYFNVLTYVSLTAPPALLYAIPVERWYGLSNAALLNFWFLGVVALWRVLLFLRYLFRLGQLTGGQAIPGLLLPIMLIITALTTLNLERAVFSIMAGLRGPEPTAHDAAYFVMLLLSLLSVYGFIPVALFYVAMVFDARKKAREGAPPESEPNPGGALEEE